MGRCHEGILEGILSDVVNVMGRNCRYVGYNREVSYDIEGILYWDVISHSGHGELVLVIIYTCMDLLWIYIIHMGHER